MDMDRGWVQDIRYVAQINQEQQPQKTHYSSPWTNVGYLFADEQPRDACGERLMIDWWTCAGLDTAMESWALRRTKRYRTTAIKSEISFLMPIPTMTASSELILQFFSFYVTLDKGLKDALSPQVEADFTLILALARIC